MQNYTLSRRCKQDNPEIPLDRSAHFTLTLMFLYKPVFLDINGTQDSFRIYIRDKDFGRDFLFNQKQAFRAFCRFSEAY
jgi:hypothetical protein